MGGRILVTGGAGFIGSNLVGNLLTDKFDVIVFDALLRRGSQDNIAWLQQHPENSRLQMVNGDIRDFKAMQAAVTHADVIFHLAGQVAVTSSVSEPRTDFEINVLGTFNLLEAARLGGRRPTVVFSSTNKVYGAIEDVGIPSGKSRRRCRWRSSTIAKVNRSTFTRLTAARRVPRTSTFETTLAFMTYQPLSSD